jgi:[ribosomal protein S5]-alanine N-acetyltransferase
MHLETERLTIRSFSIHDVPAYAAVVADPEVMRYLGEIQNRATAHAYVVDCIERDIYSGISRYAVLRRPTDELFGFCGFKDLRHDVEDGWIDFGWRYRRTAWRQGIGIEAARAVYGYGLAELGLANVEARAHQDNVASLRIIELLGFRWLEDYDTPVGVFRRYVSI